MRTSILHGVSVAFVSIVAFCVIVLLLAMSGMGLGLFEFGNAPLDAWKTAGIGFLLALAISVFLSIIFYVLTGHDFERG